MHRRQRRSPGHAKKATQRRPLMIQGQKMRRGRLHYRQRRSPGHAKKATQQRLLGKLIPSIVVQSHFPKFHPCHMFLILPECGHSLPM